MGLVSDTKQVRYIVKLLCTSYFLVGYSTFLSFRPKRVCKTLVVEKSPGRERASFWASVNIDLANLQIKVSFIKKLFKML